MGRNKIVCEAKKQNLSATQPELKRFIVETRREAAAGYPGNVHPT
jgi:hypothetical protein